MHLPRSILRLLLAAALACLGTGESALAVQLAPLSNGSLQASYTILLGGLTIGHFTLDTVIDRAGYSMTIHGSTSGITRFVSDGRGYLASKGRIAGPRILPADYQLDTKENGLTSSTVSMRMNSGTIVSVAALPPLVKMSDRVPILPQHKHNIVDPLSAMMVPLRKGDLGGACNRTIPVFDGWQRFDVRLYYKNMAQVSGENGSYSGPVAVCGARYVPVAGHRPTREAVEFMEKNTALEVWLAPVPELGVMIPFRLQIGTEVGILTIHASRFVGHGNSQRASAG